jgi:hypothetical protein
LLFRDIRCSAEEQPTLPGVSMVRKLRAFLVPRYLAVPTAALATLAFASGADASTITIARVVPVESTVTATADGSTKEITTVSLPTITVPEKYFVPAGYLVGIEASVTSQQTVTADGVTSGPAGRPILIVGDRVSVVAGGNTLYSVSGTPGPWTCPGEICGGSNTFTDSWMLSGSYDSGLTGRAPTSLTINNGVEIIEIDGSASAHVVQTIKGRAGVVQTFEKPQEFVNEHRAKANLARAYQAMLGTSGLVSSLTVSWNAVVGFLQSALDAVTDVDKKPYAVALSVALALVVAPWVAGLAGPSGVVLASLGLIVASTTAFLSAYYSTSTRILRSNRTLAWVLRRTSSSRPASAAWRTCSIPSKVN